MPSNCYELPESGTLFALRAFTDCYARTTGRSLKVYELARDLHYLREVLEDAIVCDQQDLYSAADQLVLALRAVPLPSNRSADSGSGGGGIMSTAHCAGQSGAKSMVLNYSETEGEVVLMEQTGRVHHGRK